MDIGKMGFVERRNFQRERFEEEKESRRSIHEEPV